MVLVVSEKPSVAKSLSAVLCATKHKDGHFEGGGYLVSWCYGHLVELAPPAAYDEKYKRWNRADLPILPQEWKYVASPEKKKQLDTLHGLMRRTDVDTVINSCDAGREGELIFRLVYEYCGCNKTIKRLWISSMENAAIRKGFANLRDGAEYDNLYHAALCRAKADYLIGLNMTRAFSCLYGATLAVGRVQSPTLAMLTGREAAVRAFVPEPFFTPVIDTGSFLASGERLKTAEEAETVRAACAGSTTTVLSVEKKKKSEAPPKLYDLTTLQREANRLLGYTAQQTLDVAQALYERKYITYPRTDSRFLTEDMEPGLAPLVEAVAAALPFMQALKPAIGVRQVIDSSRVGDHHALLPTLAVRDLDWDTLPTAERNILTMLIVRLACAVGEAHQFETVTAVLECGGQQFTAKGRVVLHEGWKELDAAFRIWLKKGSVDIGAEEREESGALPQIAQGQIFSSVVASVREGKTSPPPRFTEDTLLAAMESAGEDEMPDEAERKGLGTPATRAGVIEKLIRSGAVERKKKMLVPTEKGANLIAVLPEELASPLLTAEWEHRLLEVERGQMTPDAFMDGIAALTKGLVAANTAPLPAFASLFAAPPKGAVVGQCLRCGAEVSEATKGFFCSSRACKFALWKDSRFWAAKGKKLDKKIVAALLSDGRVSFTDLKSEKTGKTYAATVVLEDDGQRTNYKLDFGKEKKAA